MKAGRNLSLVIMVLLCIEGENLVRKMPVFLTEKKENPKIDWVPVVKKYTKRLDSFHRNLLSTRLKIPDNFDLFDVGVRVYNGKSAFTIPEQDKDGFTGISLRYEGEVVTKNNDHRFSPGTLFPKNTYGYARSCLCCRGIY